MVMPKQLLEGLRRVNDQPQSSLAPGDRWPRDGRQTRHWPQSQVRSRLHRKGEGKTLGRPKIAADVETAIKATLAGGTGMIKAAKMLRLRLPRPRSWQGAPSAPGPRNSRDGFRQPFRRNRRSRMKKR